MGAAARAMANFGLDDLVAVSPFGAGWREARSAVGAERLLKEARSTTMAEALKDCRLVLGTTAARRRELRKPLVPLPELLEFVAERAPTGKVAILFGSEKRGLTNRDLERCHAILHVPTSEATPSMNLSHAVAVTAYELARNGASGHPIEAPAEEPPTVEQLEDLVAKALGALERVGYMQDLPKGVQKEKLRAKFLRWRMTRQDAAFLQAFFKRVP